MTIVTNTPLPTMTAVAKRHCAQAGPRMAAKIIAATPQPREIHDQDVLVPSTFSGGWAIGCDGMGAGVELGSGGALCSSNCLYGKAGSSERRPPATRERCIFDQHLRGGTRSLLLPPPRDGPDGRRRRRPPAGPSAAAPIRLDLWVAIVNRLQMAVYDPKRRTAAPAPPVDGNVDPPGSEVGDHQHRTALNLQHGPRPPPRRRVSEIPMGLDDEAGNTLAGRKSYSIAEADAVAGPVPVERRPRRQGLRNQIPLVAAHGQFRGETDVGILHHVEDRGRPALGG